MYYLHVRLHIAADGTITGQAPTPLPVGEHEAEILLHTPEQAAVPDGAWATIRAIQDELARLPVLDPRTPDEIIGYDKVGLFG